jgi:GNAT superfamily N-acetyltransferase
MGGVSLRLLKADDLAEADGLRRLAGWNQTLEDWRRLLSLEPKGCFCAVLGGKIVGTVTTTTYGNALAWIGMMLVHPHQRGRGIGTRLMHQAVEYLSERGVRCIKLDATPAGRPLYEKLGFVPECTLTRCQRETNSPAIMENELHATRDLRRADWQAIEPLDTAVIGAPRAHALREISADSLAALVWPAQDEVLGWGLLRAGTNADYLGPLACFTIEGSVALAAALLCAAGSRAVLWDVPDENEHAREAARRWGFMPLRPLTRMRLGPALTACDMRACFAIADPSLG